MCDYSLMEFPNRLAVEGEVLQVHRFRSGSMGLASAIDCDGLKAQSMAKKGFWASIKAFLFYPELSTVPAVCVPPGARLILHDVPTSVQKQFALGPDEEVRFVQLSVQENQHRDAVRFRTGQTMRLQELTLGQRVEVVDLGDSCADEPSSLGDLEAQPIQSGRG